MPINKEAIATQVYLEGVAPLGKEFRVERLRTIEQLRQGLAMYVKQSLQFIPFYNSSQVSEKEFLNMMELMSEEFLSANTSLIVYHNATNDMAYIHFSTDVVKEESVN